MHQEGCVVASSRLHPPPPSLSPRYGHGTVSEGRGGATDSLARSYPAPAQWSLTSPPPPPLPTERRVCAAMRAALAAGAATGGDAATVAAAAVAALEASGVTNAGPTGGALTWAGTPEVDACVVTPSAYGAVGAVAGLASAVSAAAAVAEAQGRL